MRPYVLLFPLLAVSAAAYAADADVQPCVDPSVVAPAWFMWLVMGLVTAFLFIFVARISSSLRGSTWSMAEAMSEEVVEVKDGQPSTIPDPKKGDVPKTTASASRLVMVVGTIIMSAMFLGVGYFVLWALFMDPCRMGDLSGLSTYFLSGASLFAPYAVNKLTEVFKK